MRISRSFRILVSGAGPQRLRVGVRWLALVMATLSLAGCFSYNSSPSPTIVVPPGASVVCPNGSPAILTGGVYRC